MGKKVPALDIEGIARACGVKNVFTSGLDDTDPKLEDLFQRALCLKELTLVIVQIG
jgi:hypothetical protein